MKTLNETFEDDEWEQLLKKKGDLTWHEALIKWANLEEKKYE